MNFETTLLSGSGKEIVHRVMNAEKSQLLIRPKYVGANLPIGEVPDDGKYVGLFSANSINEPDCIWNLYSHLELNAALSARALNIQPQDYVFILAHPWNIEGLLWALAAEHMDCDYLFLSPKKGEHDLWVRLIQDTQPDFLFTSPSVLRALFGEDWFIPNVVFAGAGILHNEYNLLAPHCSITHQVYMNTATGGTISEYKRKSIRIPNEDEYLCFGKPLPGIEVKCEGGKGSPGPIYIHSQTAPFPEFYDTHDIGFLDAEGRLYIVQRQVITDSI